MTTSTVCAITVCFSQSCSAGKERDNESGDDYFDARYFSSNLGRFLSPDWSAKVAPVPYAKMGDPQSLNLYNYVLNNPTTNVDSDGHQECNLNCQWNKDHEIEPQTPAPALTTTTTTTTAQQQIGQDPTLPTAVEAPPPSLMDKLWPQTPGEAVNTAITVGTDGLGEVGEAGIKLLSSIGEDAKLVKYAEDAGKSVQN